MFSAFKQHFAHMVDVPDEISPARYHSMRRIMTTLMVVVSVTPLLILSGFSHQQYMKTLENEVSSPLQAMASKSKIAMDLYLGERSSTVSFIAHAYSFRELLDEATLQKLFMALKSEYLGFVDMGVVNAEGIQVDYVGPYGLKGADYSGQKWLQAAQINGVYISNVFLGLRGFPHMVIAVHRMESNGDSWTLRVTIDISRLQRHLRTAGPEQDTDIFLCDSAGTLQTSSRLFGEPMSKLPLKVPSAAIEGTILKEVQDDAGHKLLVAYCAIESTDLWLFAVRPQQDAFKPWLAFRSELLGCGIPVIILVSWWLMRLLVGRLRASDERRAAVFAQIEHEQKLSSIGRLAAGVAHEVNNPLAIISEKAGLAQDLLALDVDADTFNERRQRLQNLMESIESTVVRARSITHRLLGFARRMEASHQSLHIDDVILESSEFLSKAARNRGISIELSVQDDLPEIISDRSQLQQIFINIFGNAMDALADKKEGGRIVVRCAPHVDGGVEVRIRDNGQGMSEEVREHIFEPFYSTKKDKGTGLGMFITYSIVRRLGGEISVTSEVGAGTEFTIIFPLESPQSTSGVIR